MANVHAAGNSYDSPVYRIDVLLPNRLVVTDIRALEAQNIQGADMLIGMDIITTGDLSITNANNDTWFSFRFPPGVHIDYADQANRLSPGPEQAQNRQNLIKHLKKKGTAAIAAPLERGAQSSTTGIRMRDTSRHY